MDVTTLVGVGGATVLLVAFSLNQFNIWKHDDLIYDGANFIGGGLMVAYAFMISSWPFFALNLVWALVSFRDIIVGQIK